MLVHEATHGVVAARGIHYERALWSRIERLCVHEENRFVKRLRNQGFDGAEQLEREFDERRWEFSWTATRGQRIRALFKEGKRQ
jgi:hypothetical protein